MNAGPERTEPAAPAPFAAPSEPPTTPDLTAPIPPVTPPAGAAPPPSAPPAPSPVATSMAAFGGSESCPNCGARMATDQRYCLNCGHRRGDPRLPFMDAVVFMESMSAPGGGSSPPPPPPPAEPKSNRMNANAALIAGVATLVLAIGVGFLIGRSGHENSGSAQADAPIKVIEVGGGGGGGETAEATTPEESGSPEKADKGSKGKSSGKSPSKKKASEVKAGSKEEEERAQEKTDQVLHSKGPQAKTGAQPGDKCTPGTPGCEGEEFTGNFFGE